MCSYAHSITLTMVCLRILVFLYQPQSKSFEEVYCRNLPVNPSVHVHVSPNCKSLKTNEPILMKHYTVVVLTPENVHEGRLILVGNI